MKISINVMKSYAEESQLTLSPAELARKIGAQLGAVEETVDLTHKYDGATVARIVSCRPHTGSDHLSICLIDDGNAVKDVERVGDGLVQVVCGAPNVRAGLLVCWLPPNVIVPQSFGTAEPFVLGAREIRGEKSNGMLASLKELDIADDHSGIAELDIDAKPGTSFADAYDLAGDAIIDIENKMFTHRPDCFGNLGVAREIAGIQNMPFTSPDWYSLDAALPQPETQDLPIAIHNEIPNLVPRFIAAPLGNITIAPSPIWLQASLNKLGIRPINNVVDVTNYMMIVTGQPLHAYDYDKIKALAGGKAELTVRFPKKGEKISLLSGKEIEPTEKAMMVAAGDNLVCVGGMMGGASSEVDAHTKNIILEAATWDMYSIRRTSMQHGIFTDAVTRFSKGQSPLQNVAVISQTIKEIAKLAGGRVAGMIVDDNHVAKEVLNRGSIHPSVVTTSDFINSRLGSTLPAALIATTLRNVECKVEEHGDELIITPPFWRTDLEIAEDIVEEIGRLHGYDSLPHHLPMRDTATTELPPIDDLKNRIRTILSRAGANELQTYSFVPSRLLQQVGQEKKHAFAIRNALSPELEHYRLSLTPSLLDKVHANIKAGYDQFGLFELNKIHLKSEQDVDCDGLPREYQTVAFVFASSTKMPGAAYYYAKHYLDYLLAELGVVVEFTPVETPPGFEIGRQVFAPFEPKRSAFVYADGGDFAGFVGEYRSAVSKNLKLPAVCAGFEIDLERLLKHQHHLRYQPLIKFPATDQDICLKVKQGITYIQLESLVKEFLRGDERLRFAVAPHDIYQKDTDTMHKQITFRLALQHHDRTLTTNEVNDMLDALVQKIDATVGAERI